MHWLATGGQWHVVWWQCLMWCSITSMWSLRWHFTNKSVTRAPHLTVLKVTVCQTAGHYGEEYDDWNMQCRLEVAAELQQRWRRTNRRRKSIPRSSSRLEFRGKVSKCNDDDNDNSGDQQTRKQQDFLLQLRQQQQRQLQRQQLFALYAARKWPAAELFNSACERKVEIFLQ